MPQTEDCKKVSYAFANAFLVADEMAHEVQDVAQYAQWLSTAVKSLHGSFSLLQPHLPDKVAASFAIKLANIEEAVRDKNASEISRGAKEIQEIVLSEALPALVVVCSPIQRGGV